MGSEPAHARVLSSCSAITRCVAQNVRNRSYVSGAPFLRLWYCRDGQCWRFWSARWMGAIGSSMNEHCREQKMLSFLFMEPRLSSLGRSCHLGRSGVGRPLPYTQRCWKRSWPCYDNRCSSEMRVDLKAINSISAREKSFRAKDEMWLATLRSSSMRTSEPTHASFTRKFMLP